MNTTDVATNLIGVFCIQFLLVLISMGVGRLLIDKTINMNLEPEHLRLGTCFFVGVAFLVFFIRTGTSLTNDAKLVVISVLLIAAIFSSLRFKMIMLDIFVILGKGKTFPIIFITIVLSLLILFYWTLPLLENDHRTAISSIGSLHSYKYGWVTNFIYENNNIPIISQNTAQSILSSIGAVLLFPAPFLYLYLWLISSILFLSLFIYGIIHKLTADESKSILGLIIFMIGNTALSTTHVLTIDSGYPFFVNGYSDSLFGVFSIFFIVYINSNLVFEKKSYLNLFLISFLIVSFNFYCAPQNILFIPLLIFCFYFSCGKQLSTRLKTIAFWLVVLLFSSLVSAPQGGMLTPSTLLSNISHPAIASPSGSGLNINRGLSILPGVPYHFGWLGSWENGWMPNLEFAINFIKTGQDKSRFLNLAAWNFEQIFTTSIRIHFLPILGILFLIFSSKEVRGRFDSNGGGAFQLNKIGYYGSILFAAGFIICFPFSLNGYKWELSRFLIPGISIGMLGLSLAAIHFVFQTGFSRFFSVIFISIFVLGGPTVNIFASSGLNAYTLIDKRLFTSHFLEFIGPGPIVK